MPPTCGISDSPQIESAELPCGEPRRHLYRVRFPQSEIWAAYDGPAQDTLDLEVFQHWLEKA